MFNKQLVKKYKKDTPYYVYDVASYMAFIPNTSFTREFTDEGQTVTFNHDIQVTINVQATVPEEGK